MRFQWDALTHKWNVWVLGYNPERQRDLMLLLAFATPTAQPHRHPVHRFWVP